MGTIAEQWLEEGKVEGLLESEASMTKRYLDWSGHRPITTEVATREVVD